MSKKLYMGIGLVPLLATAAFLMAPMAAQGATCINPCHPHWYVNGSEVAQVKKYRHSRGVHSRSNPNQPGKLRRSHVTM